MTIVRLGANVVSSSPAARQFFFIYIYIYELLLNIYIHICPLQGKCQSECVVYKAAVTNMPSGDIQHYIGATAL